MEIVKYYELEIKETITSAKTIIRYDSLLSIKMLLKHVVECNSNISIKLYAVKGSWNMSTGAFTYERTQVTSW